MKVLAIIPARSGSKSIPNKNIIEINGKPLLAYSIEHALASSYIDKVIVSTDSQEYAQIALKYGAEVPFIRPAAISQDDSLDIDCFLHALQWLNINEKYEPDLCVHLRPTYPIRNPKDIDAVIELLASNPGADAVRTVSPACETPYKMWSLSTGNKLLPILDHIPEAYNMPRQQLPKVYYQNACIDAVRTKTIIEKKSMTGDVILGYLMEKNYDIDYENELLVAKYYMQINDGKRVFCFDMDGVIAEIVPDNDYSKSLPNRSNIEIINRLYKLGHKIIIFTARGYMTGINWEEVTKNQLKEWGVSYHELKFGKPAADFYVDDKFIDIQLLKNLLQRGN